MDDWSDTERHMGPAEPSPGAENSEPDFAPEDDFDPRYCIHCHKRIPIEVSDRQSACDECLTELRVRSSRTAPAAVQTYGKPPPCPECGSEDVVHDWQTDWVSKAVDITMDVAGFFIRHDRYGGAYSPDPDANNMGTPRVLRYRCQACGACWRPRL